jgi:DNA-binding NarL/FixJ family response regulator
LRGQRRESGVSSGLSVKAFGSVAPPYLEVDPVHLSATSAPSTLPSVGGELVGPARVSRASHERLGWATSVMGAASGSAVAAPNRNLGLPDELRILIVDDCTLSRDNLAVAMLDSGTVVGVAWDLPTLITSMRETPLNLVLLNLATRDSALLLGAAMKTNPSALVIALGVSEQDESAIVACAEAGVAAYHTRTQSFEDLLILISKVAAGESHCSPRVSAVLLRRLSALASDRKPASKELVLTSREAQILEMIRMGLSNREIADELYIALHTVKNHVHSVLGKLGVTTRGQAAASNSFQYAELSAKDLGRDPV